MPGESISADVFQDAACHILYRKTNAQYETSKIRAAQKALDFLIKHAEALRASERYVDAALHEIYPGLGETDLAELRVLLEEEREILRRILSQSGPWYLKLLDLSKSVNGKEFDQVINFCQKMWIQLRLKERGLEPHNGWKVHK